MVEVEREPKFMRDNVFASMHCAAYLYDDSKALSLSIASGVQVLDAEAMGFLSLAGDSGKTRLVIPPEHQPVGMKWKYTMNTSPAVTFPFGAPVAAATEWGGPDAQITVSSNTYIHAVLVDSANKPVKSVDLEIVKGA